MKTAALVLKNLSKLYKNGVVGVHGLDVEVLEGELMALVGPSGSGKSTALRLIAGLESPTDGEVYIGGKLVNNIPPRDRDIAMVFQDYALYPHLDVAGNLGFGLKMRKFAKDEIRARVTEVATMLGISDLLARKPKELSGGQRQRVALGRALIRKPKVFLFDEPLSNLDASLRVRLRQEIKEIHLALGATMVYVTHDQSEAMTLGERIVVMNAGSIEQTGSPSEIYRSPQTRFVANFFGNPAMNFAPCSVEVGSNGAKIGLGERSLKLKSRTNTPDGIRPRAPQDIRDIRLAVSRHDGTPPSQTENTSADRYSGHRKALLGFRPEDVLIGEEVEESSLTDRARVLAAEPLGGETIIYLDAGGFKLVARALGYADINPGSEIRYSVAESRLHLFDEETGKRIPI